MQPANPCAPHLEVPVSASKLAKPLNRLLFLVCVALTGAIAGAFVWLFFLLMEHGISFVWDTLPKMLGGALAGVAPWMASGPFGCALYPLVVCVAGGLVIGLYEKATHVHPEELTRVMAQVKQEGRYPYDKLGRLSLAALLPLLFGGSIGPEAGLTGVIAGLCTWVGDRLRRFGADFRALTTVGVQAALTALFTAPLYGFVAPLSGSADGLDEQGRETELVLPRAQKTFVYLFAIAGALGAFTLLGDLFGGGMGMPRFSGSQAGMREVALLIPLALVGTVGGWVYHASQRATSALSTRMGEHPVAKSVLAGLVLALCGMALPYTMFAGETQATMLQAAWVSIPAWALVATGLVKAAVTPLCINLGWRGGHFFPVIFAGISLGYGCAALLGADPVFCVAACTAATMGAVMRQPVMAGLLLILCFPLKGVVVLLAAAAIGAAIPLPKALRAKEANESAPRDGNND